MSKPNTQQIDERISSIIIDSIPKKPPLPVEWAKQNVRLIGSARSERYDNTVTNWTTYPINLLANETVRQITFVKPVQSGGSVIGEIAICYWIVWATSGDIQYNWEDDRKAMERWDKRIERIIRATKSIVIPTERSKVQKGLIMFPHCNLVVQGTLKSDNLDSDSIRFQVNEEIHNWEAGRLEKAYRRTTAYWNSKIINISNASKKGDQLYQAYVSGTMQQWQVLCPFCKQYHVMQTKWDDKNPQLGGLRYDSEGCKQSNGTYNYNKLAGTIFYQMPCGGKIGNNPVERRRLSLSGKWSEPTNKEAINSNRSFNLDAVAVDYIDWLQLVIEKHQALKAMKYGDPEPFKRYITERECKFWDADEQPVTERIVLSSVFKKRQGLPNRIARFAAIDRQRGTFDEGELPYYWLVVRDVDEQSNSLLVYEGKLLTDIDVVETLKELEVMPRQVVVDSGYDTMHIYQFCLRNGYNAIKGDSSAFFSHPDGSKKIFSMERPLCLMINQQPTRTNPLDEPQFWFYSKSGIRDRLNWLRSSKEIRWEIPIDVSDDYKSHLESEELRTRTHPRTGETIHEWVQVRKRNDLFVCECYIAMLMEMAGLIGANAGEQDT